MRVSTKRMPYMVLAFIVSVTSSNPAISKDNISFSKFSNLKDEIIRMGKLHGAVTVCQPEWDRQLSGDQFGMGDFVKGVFS